MGFFDFFKKNKPHKSTNKAEKWNLLWDLWVQGMVPSPCAELMTYDSEVNNGGHEQYFTNVENNGNLQKEMSALESILSEKLKRNLQTAYRTYLALEEAGQAEFEAFEETGGGPLKALVDTIQECDKVFYYNEQEIICILEAFASSIKIRTAKDRKVRKLVAESVERITRMEAVFDALRADPSRTDLLQELKGYYEGGQWQRDYTLDEAGLLPPDLKRGVLSQDAVYNFLKDTEEAPCR